VTLCSTDYTDPPNCAPAVADYQTASVHSTSVTSPPYIAV